MNINQIIEKLSTDRVLAEKYAKLQGIDAILEQAKADGFDVTREDVEAILSKISGKSGELSEEELAAVAGGSGPGKECGKCGGVVGECPCSLCPECGTRMYPLPIIEYRWQCPQCQYKKK